MTEFATVKLLCNQYLAINKEIISLIEQEEFYAIDEKIEQKDSLIRQISAAKKTVKFSEEELREQNNIEEQMRTEDSKILETLKELHQNTSEELGRTNKKVKVNNAYAKTIESKSGIFVDIEE